MSIKKGSIRIGTSNVTIPGNKASFPPAFRLKSRLHYYSSIFNTVEINSSFYRTPQLATYKKWADDVPDDFQFSLKLSKEITHVPGLETAPNSMQKFLHPASGIANKKGCLLIQFPGKISLDHFKQVEQLLEELKGQDPLHEWRTAVEFRNASWYVSETTELLNEYAATMVLHDFAKAKISVTTALADFIYLRFHGPQGDYRDSYTNHFLEQQATKIRHWIDSGMDVYAYFNNTIGNAYENAISLKKMLNCHL